MTGNAEMVDRLARKGRLSTGRVIEAFKSVDRGLFCASNPYVDSPRPIGSGQTISAPHMVAIMTEALELEAGMTVLEIGAGSGYQAAILARLAYPATVHTVEVVPELAERAERALESAGIDNVVVQPGDGSGGLPEHAPYDRILVSCGAPNVPPPLMDQLSERGILLIPVGRRYQDLIRLRASPRGVKKENLGGCIFVPLVGEFGVDG